jgi:hypothetical protein
MIGSLQELYNIHTVTHKFIFVFDKKQSAIYHGQVKVIGR